MKKVIATILLTLTAAIAVYAASATTVGASFSVKNDPADDASYVLHSRNTAASIDTFATTDAKVYGPYPLAAANNAPGAQSFQMMADAITGTTPTVSFDYQLIAGKTMKDTVAAWTSACTLGTTAKNINVDISTKAGDAIVFRLNNYDGTESQVPGLVKVYIKEDVTYTRER